MSTLLAAEMEIFDAAQFAEVDGDAGGTWYPTTRIILGGTGLWVTALSTLTNLEGLVQSGHLLQWDTGSNCIQQAGANWYLHGLTTLTGTIITSASGQVQIATDGGLHVLAGGTAYVDSGGFLDIYGTQTFFADGALVLQGSSGHLATAQFGSFSATAWNPGALIFDNGTWARYGSETWNTGGAVHFAAGANLHLDAQSHTIFAGGPGTEALVLWGPHTITTVANSAIWNDGGTWQRSGSEVWNGGAVSYQGGASSQFKTGTSLQMALGSTLDILGTFFVDTDMQRTGADVPSGAGAKRNLRIHTGPDADWTIDVNSWDWIIVPPLTTDRTWTLAVPNDPTRASAITVTASVCSLGANCQVRRVDASPAGKFLNDGVKGLGREGSITYLWDPNAALWRIGPSSTISIAFGAGSALDIP